MSIQAPQGILNIPNATLRVGKLAVDSTAGFDTVFNNVERNTILLVDSTEYAETKQWDLKMPNIFVATFEIKGTGSSFNFRNTSNGDATVGYTLEFSGTGLTLKYGNGDLATATIPDLDTTYGKVYLTYEKQYFTVTVDGTRVLAYKDDVTRTPPDGEYINFFAGTGTPGFKNLKVVAGHLISDGTSNVSLYGGLAVTSNLEVGQANLFVDTLNTRVGVGTTEPKESLDIVGNMHLTRVSNVSQIKVDSNVVTEYTGPHDRPLRKYPEVALTANDNSSTSGYVADQTAFSGNADGYAYRLFDHSLSTAYQSGGSQYSSGDSTGSAQTTTATDGTTHQGVAITLDLATKIRLSYAKITSHTYYGRTPVEGTFLGSNNNSTWDVIGTFSGLSTTAAGQTHTVHISDYATKSAYRYIRLVVTKIHTSAVQNGGTLLEFRELEYYGYEEGSGSLDTTLKSVYNVPATTGTQLEVYYDAKDLTAMPATVTDLAGGDQNGAVAGATLDTTYKAFVFDNSLDKITTTLPSGASGEWVHSVCLWFKRSAQVGAYDYLFKAGLGGTGNSGTMFSLLLKDDDTIWTSIYSYDTRSEVKITSNQWYHLAYTYTGGAWNPTNVKMYLNGEHISAYGSDTNPLTLSGTNLIIGQYSSSIRFNGSIANFRLYSKALNADQVKELYDYQKDYFLGSKSQLTIYKGHLGVGVTEPSGQLELAGDERIQEYPPGPMDDYETLIPGQGAFVALGGNSSSYAPWKAFDKSTSTFWIDTGIGYSDVAPYGALSTHSKTTLYDGSVLVGGWIDLECPYPVKLKKVGTAPRTNYSSIGLQRGIILGSNNGVDWYQIDTIDYAGTTPPNTLTYFDINTDSYYSHFRLVCTNLTALYAPSGNPDMHWQMSELVYFGTPGPTTLDKGSLTLGRSLDVPRISRYDVDTETPRPEKLVVDFDTTVNSSPTDISGQGNHGTLVGATYSAADKAFVFDGTDDYIYGPITIDGGNMPFTQSMWFKINGFASGSTQSFLSFFGTESIDDGQGLSYNAAGMVQDHYGSAVSFSYTFEVGRWYHIVNVYNGNTSSDPNVRSAMYLNGVRQTLVTLGTLTTQTLPTSTNFVLAPAVSGARHNGLISNSKLYSVALEPSEVKKLYNLGRTGRSMVISDTAVGIGKVPEAQLDVRGTARFDTISDFLKIDHPGNQLSLSRSDTDANEFRWYTWGNGCNWFTPYTGMSIYIGRDGQTIDEFDFYSVTTVKRGGTTLHSSDDRLKRDETFITNATNSILKLKPQTYIKKHRLPENENDTDIPEQFEAGLIAQDVWYDAPELRFLVHPSKDANPSETKPISPDPNDPTQDPDYSSWGTRQAYVNYEGFLPYLIKSNQEIYTELQAEKAKNEALETQVSDLLVRVTALENA